MAAEQWDLSPTSVSAVATLLAVVVALFGPWLQRVLWPPKLQIRLADSNGHAIPTRLLTEKGEEVIKARWYHVRIENKARWNPVTQVQLFVLRMDQKDASGNYRPFWRGELPLKWRHMPVDVGGRTVGHGIDSDFFSVYQSGELNFQPAIASTMPLRFEKGCQIRVVLQARGLEADSNTLGLEVHYDGVWHDANEYMLRHMVINEFKV